ncbi:hypothetical protein BU16DRAFT_523693 [Lophium mytilinum]|uniref:N-acetyltransferase B complex non catalytic subunit n=1 Tax=Lophium mytilinum TaxID=390894 RepID=A0A6A6R5J0_9PEZI|nr:hypothetical protein BU16DRAFT_523693 [Lophium mytilinum]
MALNFDKLAHLQSNYDKPKLGLKECNRRLQKHPQDPYLLAWKVDLISISDPGGAQTIWANLCKKKPPITDTELLPYVYSLSPRLAEGLHTTNTAGPESRTLWQNAANQMNRSADRARLFNICVNAAKMQDCWEDVRWALLQYRKETPSNAKPFFTYIVASQLSAEKEKSLGNATGAMIASSVAYKFLKAAWDNVESKPGAVDRITDTRQLRLMYQIFQRQNRGKEFLELLEKAPPGIQAILSANHLEVLKWRLDTTKEEKLWRQLWDVTSKLADDSSKFIDWRIWSGMLAASDQFESEEDKNLADETFRQLAEAPAQSSREARLAILTYGSKQSSKEKLLLQCKKYWDEYSAFNCCFNDLRHIIEPLDQSAREAFLSHARNGAVSMKLSGEGDSTKKQSSWLQAEVNALKFDYLLNLSRPEAFDQTVLETFICNCIRLYKLGVHIQHSSNYDAGLLAVMSLVKLHHCVVTAAEKTQIVQNARYLLQAAYLLQDMTAGSQGDENRQLVLVSIRVHTLLGLGNIALGLISDVKTKEFLYDTVAYTWLSRISLTFPLGSAKPKTTDPSSNLAAALQFYGKASRNINDFLKADIQTFQFDQGLELVDFKRKLDLSLVKHINVLERRRVARLKGVPCDEADLSFLAPDIKSLVDSRDFSIIPSFESSSSHPFHSLLAESPYPDYSWFIRHTTIDDTWSILAEENSILRNPGYRSLVLQKLEEEDIEKACLTDIERLGSKVWMTIHSVARQIMLGHTSKNSMPQGIQQIHDWLNGVFQTTLNTFFELRSQGEDTDLADALILPTSGSLQTIYYSFELLRTVTKLCDVIQGFLKQKAPHKAKEVFKKEKIAQLANCAEEIYKSIGTFLNARLKEVIRIGERSLRAQLQHGSTGAALQELMKFEDYAGYLDAAKDAYKTALKVSLRGPASK